MVITMIDRSDVEKLKAYVFEEGYKDVLIGFAERSPYPSNDAYIDGDNECFYCCIEEHVGRHTADCIWQRLQYLIEKE